MAFTLLEVTLSASFLIAAVLLISIPLNKRYSGNWRYWAWLLIAIRLLIPIGASSFPAFPSLIQIPIFQSATSSERPDSTPESSGRPTANSSGAHSSAPVNSQPSTSHSFPVVNSRPAQSASLPGITQSSAAPSTGSTPSLKPPVSAPATPANPQWPLNVSETILLLWGSGTVFFLGFHITSAILFRRSLHLHKTGAVPAEVEAIFRQCCEELNLRRPIAVAHYHLASPMAIGLWHPIVLLPDSVCALSPEDLRMVLLHELTHLKRRDMERKLILLLAACVHWFNPLVWLMLRCSGQDMESTCDDAVLARCDASSKDRYCRLLLTVAGNNSQSDRTSNS